MTLFRNRNTFRNIPEWLFLLNVKKTIIPNLECEPAYKAIWAAVNKLTRRKKKNEHIMADNRKRVSALASVAVVALELLEENDELEVDTF